MGPQRLGRQGNAASAVAGDVSFLADMGNWEGADKYEKLAAVFGRAERCHTKAHLVAGLAMDREDYVHCLEAENEGGYSGPHTLVYEGDDNEWAGIDSARWVQGMRPRMTAQV